MVFKPTGGNPPLPKTVETEIDRVVRHALAGLKQILLPNKTQTAFISREYVPIFVQLLHKSIRYGFPKRFEGVSKGV